MNKKEDPQSRHPIFDFLPTSFEPGYGGIRFAIFNGPNRYVASTDRFLSEEARREAGREAELKRICTD